jgi:PDZ domain-containing protein
VLTRLLKALTPLRLATAGVFVLALAFVVFLTRDSADYLEVPHEARPLAGLVSVQGGETQRDGGGIYYVDVIIKRASLIETLIPALRPDGSDLIEGGQFLTPGISDRERLQLELADMKLSQVIASAVALRALGYNVPVRLGGVRIVAVTSDSHAVGLLRRDDVIVSAEGRPVRRREDLQAILARHRVGDVVRIGIRRGGRRLTLRIKTTSDEREPRRPLIGVLPAQALRVSFPFRIRFNLGEVGGPSAGLAFALELLEKRGRDIDHGYKVAATGEIQLDGSVTRIGGVKQKTIGARQADVDVFLVPVDGDNAREAKRYAKDLRIIPVKSFQQALRALATLPRKS